MIKALWRGFGRALAAVLAPSVVCPPVRALVSLNDGRDRIYVTGSVSVSQDSNIFASSAGEADVVYASGITAEYTRRAGWIGMNANLSVNSSHFAKFEEEDFTNPGVSVEFTKQTGRTTGSITLSGSRENRADPTVNLRTDSWNYNGAVNFKYPIINVYTLTGQYGYSSREYVDEAVFSSLATHTASLDLYKILSMQRELIAGYRFRHSQTSRNVSTDDHSTTIGVSGRLMRGVQGSVRAGYQVRQPTGGGAPFSSWTTSTSTSYKFNKRLAFNAQVSKDFSTTATDSSADVLSATVDASYAMTSRLGFNGSATWGNSQFLGEGGRVILSLGPPPVFGPNRRDTYVTWTVAGSYALNERLKFGVSYVWFQNWSTVDVADFVRASWSLNVSSRW